MKTMLLLALLASCATLSRAQTTPSTPPTAASPTVAGTKNVGADRADAPQAPGMSATPTTAPGQKSRPRATTRKTTTGKLPK